MSKKRRYKQNLLSYEEKVFIVNRILESDLSLSDVAEDYQIGASTIRGWLHQIDYDLKNTEKLKRKRTGILDRQRPILTELPEWVQQEIVQQKKLHPSMGALKLKQHFFRHHQTILSEKKIYFYLKKNNLLAKSGKERQKPTAHSRRFEYPYPLAAVQLDILSIRLVNKSKIYLVTLLDDYSRYILCSRLVKEKTMSNVISTLMHAVKHHGVMERIICDKGSEFVSWQSFTLFEEKLCELDIELIASGPQTPQNQGKIERWHQSYRQECEGKAGGFDSYAQAQLETDRYVNYYNYERVHQGIGGLVPADRYYGLSDDIERELSQYHQKNHEQKCIYFSCNINGQRIVVSGLRNGALSIYQNKDDNPDESKT